MDIIETERLILRKFEITDADDCFEYLSDKETCYMDGGYEPWLSKDESFYKLMDLFQKQEGRYMIVTKDENKVIGTIFLRNALFRVVKAKEVGYVINPNYRKKGYMSEALNALVPFLRNNNIELLCAKAYEHNEPSLAFLHKFGFVEEGRLVKSFCYPGKEPGALVCFYYPL